MIWKTIGAACIVLASSLLGFYWSRIGSYRIEDLRSMKKALTMLKSEILYAISPLPDALRNISIRVDRPAKDILLECSEELRKKKGQNANTIWSRAIENHKSQTYFEKPDLEAFFAFGQTLGYLDKQMQIQNIEITLEYLSHEIEVLREKQEKNQKLYQSLGILGGLLIAIVLI